MNGASGKRERGRQLDWRGEPSVLQPCTRSWEKAVGGIKDTGLGSNPLETLPHPGTSEIM